MAVFEDKDKLMPAAVERAHSRIVLDPDDEIFQLGVDLAAAGHDLLDVTPIHADVVQRAIDAEFGKVPEGGAQKGGEFGPVHLARSQREGSIVDRAGAGG